MAKGTVLEDLIRKLEKAKEGKWVRVTLTVGHKVPHIQATLAEQGYNVEVKREGPNTFRIRKKREVKKRRPRKEKESRRKRQPAARPKKPEPQPIIRPEKNYDILSLKTELKNRIHEIMRNQPELAAEDARTVVSAAVYQMARAREKTEPELAKQLYSLEKVLDSKKPLPRNLLFTELYYGGTSIVHETAKKGPPERISRESEEIIEGIKEGKGELERIWETEELRQKRARIPERKRLLLGLDRNALEKFLKLKLRRKRGRPRKR